MDDLQIERDAAQTNDSVRHYYGEVLKSSTDLKTSACCTIESVPLHIRPILAQIHPEVLERYYGCGSPMPPALEGMTVLDLGCGSGRDCYVLSKLVGATGRVIGVDMTPEQLAVAHKHRDWHAAKFGYASSNVTFLEGLIEDLAALGIADGSVDVVVSNCVANLSPNKPKLFSEIMRVLKPGGELYFSDVFADKRVPLELQRDPVLLGECLGGAIYKEDFRRILQLAGCADARVLKSTPIELLDVDVVRKIGHISFTSLTVRAFKLALEDRCEDFGQVATYLGTIPEFVHAFDLDDHHHFITGKPMLVCGNTADMLSATRYAKHFRHMGAKTTHFGLFDCGPTPLAAPVNGAACC
jgi:arsenite methyltransferase